MSETRQLSRQELYELVWARPVTQIAEEFGLSDVALHKICKKHRVPVPARGYWAKFAAGKPVKQTAFRQIRDSYLDRILINRSPLKSLPPAVIKAGEGAKARTRARLAEPLPEPSTNAQAHPLLERLRQIIEKAKPGNDGFVRVSGRKLFSVSVSPSSTERLLSVLDLLVREAEASGHDFEPVDDGLQLNIDGERLSLYVSEKTDKIPHQATEKELTSLRRWEAERERKKRRGEWYGDWGKPKIPEWDDVANGLLGLCQSKTA